VLVLTSLTLAQTGASRHLIRWIYHLGGPGLILLGMLDNSIVPVAGSMDIITVLLCANDKSWWAYYVFMATAGALAGGYTTYLLARGESKSKLADWLKQSKLKSFRKVFERWGFGAIVVPAILPPPFPMVPFLIAAGATRYPRGKFIAALAIGRGIRYAILGVLGYLYGRWIITVFRQHVVAFACLGGALVLASIAAGIFRLRYEAAAAH
jgi:membrane protein YqaA with SNARE-associated domain